MDKQVQQKLIQSIASDYVKETGDQKPDQKKLQSYIQKKGGEKYLQKKMTEIQSSEKEQAKAQAKKALHGTKLNYIRRLNHQCPEGYELVYYKKGGVVDCGCKQEGGPIDKKQPNNNVKPNNTINQRNNTWTKKDDKKLLNYRKNGTKTPQEKRDSINIQKKWNNLPEKEKRKYEVQEGKCGKKLVKRSEKGSKVKYHDQDVVIVIPKVKK